MPPGAVMQAGYESSAVGPNGALIAVSCAGPVACTAVGGHQSSGGGGTLAEAWNGTSWRIQATPNPARPPSASALEGVSCTSARACTAVGTFGPPGVPGRTLAERWNGIRWVIQGIPNPPANTPKGHQDE